VVDLTAQRSDERVADHALAFGAEHVERVRRQQPHLRAVFV
jgi:hypothetical protein